MEKYKGELCEFVDEFVRKSGNLRRTAVKSRYNPAGMTGSYDSTKVSISNRRTEKKGREGKLTGKEFKYLRSTLAAS